MSKLRFLGEFTIVLGAAIAFWMWMWLACALDDHCYYNQVANFDPVLHSSERFVEVLK